jgi:hypothetical protein
MKDHVEAVDEALTEVEKARKRVAKGKSKQVTKVDEVDYLKAVSYAWFNAHRKLLLGVNPQLSLGDVDSSYRKVLDSTARNAARTTYVEALRGAKEALAALRAQVLLSPLEPKSKNASAPPDFSSIAADVQMQMILVERWEECEKCLASGAYLAATVMMGGLLETLFVARANKLSDKRPLFSAKSTPIDQRTKKPLPLPEWTLRPYIDVAHEIGWITRSGKDVAAVLRDYRNYVHPEKQRSHGVKLQDHDAKMFWDVTRNLVIQLLAIASPTGGKRAL